MADDSGPTPPIAMTPGPGGPDRSTPDPPTTQTTRQPNSTSCVRPSVRNCTRINRRPRSTCKWARDDRVSRCHDGHCRHSHATITAEASPRDKWVATLGAEARLGGQQLHRGCTPHPCTCTPQTRIFTIRTTTLATPRHTLTGSNAKRRVEES